MFCKVNALDHYDLERSSSETKGFYPRLIARAGLFSRAPSAGSKQTQQCWHTAPKVPRDQSDFDQKGRSAAPAVADLRLLPDLRWLDISRNNLRDAAIQQIVAQLVYQRVSLWPEDFKHICGLVMFQQKMPQWFSLKKLCFFFFFAVFASGFCCPGSELSACKSVAP